jgi:hypothetical protein
MIAIELYRLFIVYLQRLLWLANNGGIVFI